jgi:RNA polymerase sigma-70 factor (ECF subfamily)
MNVDRVYHYLLGRMAEPADAEDVTAEVFIRAMKALPKYKDQGVPFVALLFRIAHNLWVNHLKKQGIRKETVLEDTMPAPNYPAETAVERAAVKEVLEAMESLTPLQQEVRRLRFAGQLTIMETATVMEHSQAWIKSLQFSALRALRGVLASQEVVTHGG